MSHDDRMDALSYALTGVGPNASRPTVDDLPDPGSHVAVPFDLAQFGRAIAATMRERIDRAAVAASFDRDDGEIAVHVDPERLVEEARAYAFRCPRRSVWVIVPTDLHMRHVARLLGRPIGPLPPLTCSWRHDVPIGESMVSLFRVTGGSAVLEGPVHHARWLVVPAILPSLSDRVIARGVRFALERTRRESP